MTAVLTSLLRSLDGSDHPGRIIERVMHVAREHLGLQVAFVAEFDGSQRVFRYANGDLQRFSVQVDGAEPLEGTYCSMVCSGVLEPLVQDARHHPQTGGMPITEALGVDVYLGVPLHFSDGSLYGTLCCLSQQPNPALGESDVVFLRMAAAIVAEQLERDEIAEVGRAAAVSELRAALDGGLWVVHQPVVDLRTWQVVGYEALSRFPSESGRGPQQWFEQAWAVGLGAELELAAVRTALATLPLLPQDVYLAVNISPDTLLSPLLGAALGQAPPDRVVLEITEHAQVFDYRPATQQLQALRREGFRVAIDDLGTGHAGVNHLLQFSPDVLKIDRSVVQGVRRDPLRRAVTATFATLAAHLGAALVAEGVETEEDRDALEVLGVTAAQGYLLGRPAPWPADLRARGAGAAADSARTRSGARGAAEDGQGGRAAAPS